MGATSLSPGNTVEAPSTLNQMIDNLTNHLNTFEFRATPPPIQSLMAEQRELQTCINIQMAGINWVTTQLQAASSPENSSLYTPGSDEHPENWSLDVMMASTNPAALSTDMGERLQIK